MLAGQHTELAVIDELRSYSRMSSPCSFMLVIEVCPEREIILKSFTCHARPVLGQLCCGSQPFLRKSEIMSIDGERYPPGSRDNKKYNFLWACQTWKKLSFLLYFHLFSFLLSCLKQSRPRLVQEWDLETTYFLLIERRKNITYY